MSSAANDSDALPPAFNDLQVVELDSSSRQCPYNALQWHSYPDGKHYACIAIELEAVFLAGESQRGQCTLMKHRDRPTDDLLQSVTYLCSHSNERKRQREARQELGHAAARQLVQRTKKTGTAAVSAGLLETAGDAVTAVPIRRVNKNSTGESVTCAACRYRLQLKGSKQAPQPLPCADQWYAHK
jgi:hypothetical protein